MAFACGSITTVRRIQLVPAENDGRSRQRATPWSMPTAGSPWRSARRYPQGHSGHDASRIVSPPVASSDASASAKPTSTRIRSNSDGSLAVVSGGPSMDERARSGRAGKFSSRRPARSRAAMSAAVPQPLPQVSGARRTLPSRTCGAPGKSRTRDMTVSRRSLARSAGRAVRAMIGASNASRVAASRAAAPSIRLHRASNSAWDSGPPRSGRKEMCGTRSAIGAENGYLGLGATQRARYV